MGGCNDSQQDFLKERHNNINNNITNSKINKISGACAATAAPPHIPIECMDIVNDFKNGIINKSQAQNLIEEWWYDEISKLVKLNHNLNMYHLVDDGSEEYKKAKEIDDIGREFYSFFNNYTQ